MVTLGEASIEIVADLRAFNDALNRRVNAALRRLASTAAATFSAIRDSVGAGARALRDLANRVAGANTILGRLASTAAGPVRDALVRIGSVATVSFTRVRAGVAGAVRALRDVTDRVAGANTALGRLATAVRSGTSDALQRLGRLGSAALRGITDTADRAVAGMRRIRDGVEDATRALRRFADNLSGRANALLRRLGEDGEEAFSNIIERVGDLNRALRRLSLTLVLTAAKVSLLTGAFVALYPVFAAVATATASLTGLLLAVPAAFLAVKVAVYSLKFASQGLSEAFSQVGADSKAFEKSMENLPANTEKLARTVRALKPAYDSVQFAAQNALLLGMSETTRRLASRYMPMLASTTTSIARSANDAARQIGSLLDTELAQKALGPIFDQTRQGVQLLAGSLDHAVLAMLDLLRASGTTGIARDAFAVLNSYVREFSASLSEAASNGELEKRYLDAVQTAKDLLDISRQVKDIFSGILAPISFDSRPLKVVSDSLTAVADVINGPVFQSVASQVFENIKEKIGALAAVAPQIVSAIASIGPALGSIGTSVSAASVDLLKSAATAIEDLAPLINAAGKALEYAAPHATALVLGFGALKVAMAGLALQAQISAATSLTVWISQLPIVVGLTTAWGLAMSAAGLAARGLAAGLALATGPIGLAVLAIAAIGAGLYLAYTKIRPFREAVDAVASAVASAAVAVWEFVKSIDFSDVAGAVTGWFASIGSTIGAFFTGIGTWIGTAWSAIGTFFSQLPGRILTALAALPGIAMGALSAMGTAMVTAVTGFVTTVVPAFVTLVADIATTLLLLPVYAALYAAQAGAWIWQKLQAGFALAAQYVSAGVSAVASFVASLPGRIAGALSAAATAIWSVLSAGWTKAKEATLSGISSIGAFVASLPGRIGAAVSALPGIIGGAFRTAWEAGKKAAVSGANSVVDAFRALPGRIKSIGAGLYSAGKDLIGQMMRGLVSAGGAVGDVAGQIGSLVERGVKGTINSAMKGIENALNRLPDPFPDVHLPRFADGAVVKSGVPRAFAQGGIVQRATFGVFGEAGPEVILPLSKPDRVRKILAQPMVATALAKAVGKGQASSKGTSTGQALSPKTAATLARASAKTKTQMQRTATASSVLTNPKVVAAIAKAVLDEQPKTKGKKGKKAKVVVPTVKAILGDPKVAAAIAKAVGGPKASTVEAAKTKLTDLINQRYQAAQDVKASAISFAGISGYTSAQGGEAPSVTTFTAYLKDRLAQVAAFQRNIALLAKKGLNKELLSQIVGSGVEGGGALAETLAKASKTQLQGVNALQDKINKAAALTGKTASDALYTSGVEAARGLVKGLESQQAAVEAMMIKIAKGMQSAIKKALGIRSPSTIMSDQVGEPVTAGIIRGLDQHKAAIASTMRVIADSLHDQAVSAVVTGISRDTAPLAPISRAALAADQTRRTTPDAPGQTRNAAAQAAGARTAPENISITVVSPFSDADATARLLGARLPTMIGAAW
jgi:hypothetical protein